MEKYICTVCDYVYDPELGDPENGIEPGTSFEDLPEDWVCPLCGAPKSVFEGQSTPAPKSAAAELIPLPIITGTTSVAAIIARS